MKRIWDQMSCTEYEKRRQARVARLSRQPSESQQEANYVLKQMHAGKPHNVKTWIDRRNAGKAKKKRMRDAFSTLRQLGMI